MWLEVPLSLSSASVHSSEDLGFIYLFCPCKWQGFFRSSLLKKVVYCKLDADIFSLFLEPLIQGPYPGKHQQWLSHGGGCQNRVEEEWGQGGCRRGWIQQQWLTAQHSAAFLPSLSFQSVPAKETHCKIIGTKDPCLIQRCYAATQLRNPIFSLELSANLQLLFRTSVNPFIQHGYDPAKVQHFGLIDLSGKHSGLAIWSRTTAI